jgi:hypothetical protein
LYRRFPPLLDVEVAQPGPQEQRSPHNRLQRFFSTRGRKLGL